MKLASLFLLLAGWGIVVSAIVLFAAGAMRGVFALAGIGLEALGLSLAVRAHLFTREPGE